MYGFKQIMNYAKLLEKYKDEYNQNNSPKLTTADIARAIKRSRSHTSNIFKGNDSQPPLLKITKAIAKVLKLSEAQTNRLFKAAVRERIDLSDKDYLVELGIWKLLKDKK